jgi:pSer/pThr/pTyr-binding forkhead associated (FHA) protein
MRFCVECGFGLGDAAPAPASPPAPSAPPAPAAAPAPIAAPRARTCWRCRGLGDPGSEFCKFCGARYADEGKAPPATAAELAQSARTEETAQARSAAPSRAWSEPAPAHSEPQAHRGAATAIDSRPEPKVQAAARLIAILKDGSDGRVYPLAAEQSDIGRSEGDVILPDDPYLSPRHARLKSRGGNFVLSDLDSVNGTYIRIREPVELADGDMILIGQQVLRFEVLSDGETPLGPASLQGVLVFGTPEVPRIARLHQYTTEGVGRDVHYLYRDETVLGRENGDIVFTDDPFLSRRHASITIDRANKRYVLRDLSSSNGTSIRFHGERELVHGDQFRVGRHLFRFDRQGAGGGR